MLKLKNDTEPSPAPTARLTADPISITAGGSSTLSWTSSNADRVSISPDSGSVSASGTTTVTPSQTTTYTITAEGPGGTATDTVTVTISDAPFPLVFLSAYPTSISAGDSAFLIWASMNADSVSIDNGVGLVDFSGFTFVTPTITTIYTITAQGPGGTATDTVTVEVAGTTPAPTVTISADPTSITAGDSSTLNWISTNADSVSIDKGIGTVDLNGSVAVAPTETSTYTITATGAGGTATDTVTVEVSASPAPTVSLSADPTSITAGGSATLSWTSTNADSVTIDNGIGTVDLNASVSVTPSATTTYTITATGAGGTATDTATVEVLPAADEPVITISADPISITAGGSATLTWTGSATLTWTGSNVDKISIDNGIGEVAATGSRSVTPEHTTTYTITGSGDKGTVSAQVTVQVTGSPAAQPEGSYGEQYDDLVPDDATVDAYDEERFALITGQVHNLSGSPLAEVRITVHGHPEYGTVLTDTDGRFTMPVEGGGP
ncbi:hypothetical protein [Candidatus Electrothrix sp.]|uniref:hypothetical protein n=1 Tax=Candidatus Electrothrix sp. TaxID=2170559 RepID=UPI0040573037